MNRSTPNRGLALSATALALALVAVIAFVAGGTLGRAGDPGSSPAPSDKPSPTPVVTPAPSADPTPDPTPTPTPTPEPSDDPGDGFIRVPLNTGDNHDVTVIIDDRTGTITNAASGNPGDGMSVRWKDMKVENLGPNVLQLTWVGLPFDGDTHVFLYPEGGEFDLLVAQPLPPENSDALGFDRVLILTFDRPVSADDLTWIIQDGIDTEG